MKYLRLLSIIFMFSAVAVQAQKVDSVKSLSTDNSKFFIGAGLSNTGYQFVGKPKYGPIAGIMPFLTLQYGYILSKRATIQVGIGYGGNTISGYSLGTSYLPDSVSDKEQHQRIKAVVFPLTLKYTPFNTYKRLQVYGNVSLVPVIGNIKADGKESYPNSSTLLYNENMTGITIIATAGLTLNYRLSNKMTLFVDGIGYYRNFELNFQSPNFLDHASAGIGLNYRLLKEK